MWWRRERERGGEGEVTPRLDGDEGGEMQKKMKEVQKERTGLSLCFGWRGIQQGKGRQEWRGCGKEKGRRYF